MVKAEVIDARFEVRRRVKMKLTIDLGISDEEINAFFYAYCKKCELLRNIASDNFNPGCHGVLSHGRRFSSVTIYTPSELDEKEAKRNLLTNRIPKAKCLEGIDSLKLGKEIDQCMTA